MSSKQTQIKISQNGDFISWKKNIPINYSSFVSRILEWSSFTCQFLSSIQNCENNVLKKQQILFGTNNPKKEDNNLIIANLNFFNQEYQQDNSKQKLEEYFQQNKQCIQIQQKIPHKGPVLISRALQNNKSIIATRSPNNNVYIYKLQQNNQEQKYDVITLKGHQQQGNTLDWKNNNELITSSTDGQICIWDINKQPIQQQENNQENYIEPLFKYNYHFKPITDVKFHKFQNNLFGYTTDHHVVIWDQRESKQKPFMNVLAHIDQTTSLDFCPNDQFLLLTGAKTGRVKLWDLRRMNLSLQDLEHCQEEILKVQWAPNLDSVFASSSLNGQIKLWDLSQLDINSKKQNIDFLTHNGHKGIITDFNWNNQQELSLISTDNKNQLHFWQVKEEIFYKENLD